MTRMISKNGNWKRKAYWTLRSILPSLGADLPAFLPNQPTVRCIIYSVYCISTLYTIFCDVCIFWRFFTRNLLLSKSTWLCNTSPPCSQGLWASQTRRDLQFKFNISSWSITGSIMIFWRCVKVENLLKMVQRFSSEKNLLQTFSFSPPEQIDFPGRGWVGRIGLV